MLRGDSRRSLAALTVMVLSLPVMLVYCIATSPVDPTTQREFVIGAASQAAPDDGRIRLPRRNRVAAGDSAFVFRGLKGNEVHLDHYLLASNPRYAYRHVIPLLTARRGFRLGARSYRLLSADAEGIVLQPLSAGASP